jgi:hypothetical protein
MKKINAKIFEYTITVKLYTKNHLCGGAPPPCCCCPPAEFDKNNSATPIIIGHFYL